MTKAQTAICDEISLSIDEEISQQMEEIAAKEQAQEMYENNLGVW